MRRATAITLALMGGGVALAGAVADHRRAERERACQAERLFNPNTQSSDCVSTSSSGTHAGGGSSSGWGTGSASAASARGGFGATGAAHAGGGE